MITLNHLGDTTIRIAQTGHEDGLEWTVFAVVNRPGMNEDDKNLIRSLSINETDTPGTQPDFNKRAQAVNNLLTKLRDLSSEKDLKLEINGIDTDADGELAKILDNEYDIRSVEGFTSGETRK